MRLTINGQPRVFDTQLTINQLLQQLDLAADRVIVELNREILTAAAHDTQLNDGDTLEVVQFVGGG